jgi:hypothetical protein
MKQIPIYSFVIFPNFEQLNIIKLQKKELKENIGWFGSANSDAHVTIINIENELTFGLYLNQIKDFCKTITPQKVKFNSFNSFGNHTFYISPDEESQLYLNKIIIDLYKFIGFELKNAHAHITIARRLDEERMKKAQQQFSSTIIDFEFICNCIYVRRFNEQTKQYSDIIEKLNFK